MAHAQPTHPQAWHARRLRCRARRWRRWRCAAKVGGTPARCARAPAASRAAAGWRGVPWGGMRGAAHTSTHAVSTRPPTRMPLRLKSLSRPPRLAQARNDLREPMLPQGGESPDANDGPRRSTIDGRPPRTLHGEATRRGCAAVACPGRRPGRADLRAYVLRRTSSQRKAARSACYGQGGSERVTWQRATEWRRTAEGRAQEAREAAGRAKAQGSRVERDRIALDLQPRVHRLKVHLPAPAPRRTCDETRTGTSAVGHQLRATGDFIRLTGEGRWWYVMDEGLAARGWRQQNYCGRCSGPQHKQSSDRRRLAWAVIGRRGGAHASKVTGIERKASCVPRSTRAEKQSAASFGRRRAAARAAEAPPCCRKRMMLSWVTPAPREHPRREGGGKKILFFCQP